nr:MAG TPA: hypothetical protein [Caudoviricetes sp.]
MIPLGNRFRKRLMNLLDRNRLLKSYLNLL